MKYSCGIYAIGLLGSTLRLVGSSRQIEVRWEQHRRNLRSTTHDNQYLQRLWDKYGEDAFEFWILEFCDETVLIDREQYWIDRTSVEDRINLAPAGQPPSRVGRRHSVETRQKMSSAKQGIPYSKDRRDLVQGQDNPNAKLTWDRVREIRRLWSTGQVTKSQLARDFGVDWGTIQMVLNNVTWIE